MIRTDDPLALLADRALAGDRRALEELCKSLQGPVFRLALRVLGQPADASDATQEILLKVATHLSQFRGESRFLTWAYTIAIRHVSRVRKRRDRGLEVEALATRIRGGLARTEPDDVPDGAVGPVGPSGRPGRSGTCARSGRGPRSIARRRCCAA